MDTSMARNRYLVALSAALIAALAFTTPAIQAQTGDPALIQQKLLSEFKLAKPTSDHTDLVSAGDVILLHKDGLMMCSSASSYAYSNTYSAGVLTASQRNRTKDAAKSFIKGLPFGGGSPTDAANNGCQSRKFVSGEKFWLTGITAQKDGITFAVISDPYQDTRYYGELKFVFPHGTVPTTDDFVKTVAEVLTVDHSNDNEKQGNDSNAAPAQGQAQQQQQAQPQEQTPPPAPMADIPPPPPPADTPPPSIAVGQTVAQVTAAFGQPTRIANLGTKQIYYYKDMKVTFTNGKVSNVQ
jgi:hypothetical protein